MGTQKNSLNETFFLTHPQHMFKLMVKKIITFLCIFFFLTGPKRFCILYINRFSCEVTFLLLLLLTKLEG